MGHSDKYNDGLGGTWTSSDYSNFLKYGTIFLSVSVHSTGEIALLWKTAHAALTGWERILETESSFGFVLNRIWTDAMEVIQINADLYGIPNVAGLI